MNLEVFAYKFFFEFHEQIAAIFHRLSNHQMSGDHLFLFELLLAGIVLLMRPCRKAIVVPLSFGIALAPTILRFVTDGPPGLVIPEYGRLVPLSHLMIMAGLFLTGFFSVSHVLAGQYRMREFGAIGVLTAISAGILIVAVSFVSQVLLVPPEVFDRNMSTYVAWLGAHLVLRSLVALGVLGFFNYLGLLRPRYGTVLLAGSGTLAIAYAAYLLSTDFSYYVRALSAFA